MKEIYPSQMQVEFDNENKTILAMHDGKENKKSQMIIYHIFNGLDLIYNKFNTFVSPEPSNENKYDGYIEINYCKRGVYECEIESEKYMYLGEGEIASNANTLKRLSSGFPTGYYEGIELLIDIETLKKVIPPMFSEISCNVENLRKIILQNAKAMVLKPIPEMIHIFDELYYINPEEQKIYAQIKILELLLVFTTIPLNRELAEKTYIEKTKTDIIKKIRKEITNNLDKRITIEMLSKKYKIGTTPLKKYFKEIYGEPLYTYLKNYKIHTSLHLLEETDKNINEIAGIVGYDNSSKFAKVFKEKMGCTPNEYRKQKVHLEHERLFGVEIK